MPPNVVTGAMTLCTFGTAPSSLNAISAPTVLIEGKPAATISDAQPMASITPFGTCMSLANPTTASLTAAALGVLTPGPCIPATVSWVPQAPTTLIAGKPALVQGSICTCAFGGVVSVSFAGTTRTLTD